MVRRSVHKLRFDASVIARIIGSFDLRPVSRRELAAGRRTQVTPLSGARTGLDTRVGPKFLTYENS